MTNFIEHLAQTVGSSRRYSDEQILDEIRRSAERLGCSPTMRQFSADPESDVSCQTVIARFGKWNDAKRAAGLTPRRFISRDDLLEQLRQLGSALGRTPTARDLDANRRRVASRSLIWHTFGSLGAALKEAGFDVPGGEERLERAVAQGAVLARSLRRLPTWNDWVLQRRSDPALISEWVIFRSINQPRAWIEFQMRILDRVREEDERRDKESAS